MEKKLYMLRLEVGNRVEFDTLKTVWKMETVMRKAREELEPRFPKAKLVITCGDTMVTIKWEPERKAEPVMKMAVQTAQVEKKIVYPVLFTYTLDGRYITMRREFTKKDSVKPYVQYLSDSGCKDIAWERFEPVEKDWRKRGMKDEEVYSNR